MAWRLFNYGICCGAVVKPVFSALSVSLSCQRVYEAPSPQSLYLHAPTFWVRFDIFLAPSFPSR
jgi:hypothetical protein